MATALQKIAYGDIKITSAKDVVTAADKLGTETGGVFYTLICLCIAFGLWVRANKITGDDAKLTPALDAFTAKFYNDQTGRTLNDASRAAMYSAYGAFFELPTLTTWTEEQINTIRDWAWAQNAKHLKALTRRGGLVRKVIKKFTKKDASFPTAEQLALEVPAAPKDNDPTVAAVLKGLSNKAGAIDTDARLMDEIAESPELAELTALAFVAIARASAKADAIQKAIDDEEKQVEANKKAAAAGGKVKVKPLTTEQLLAKYDATVKQSQTIN